VSLYRVPSPSASDADEQEVPGGGALMVAVRAADLVRPAGAGGRAALTVAGTARIRTGELAVFCKIVLAAPAQVRRRGQVQAQGSPCDHATLGPLEERLDAASGRGVIDGIADGTRLAGPVKGKRKRLLSAAFVLRAIVLMTLMPDAGAREVLLALAGDLAMVPWARDWRPASPRSLGQWRQAAGPEPLEELQRVVLGAAREEHDEHDWRAVVIGRLKAASADGTLIRMPETPANRAAFGSTGTADDSAPFPQLRGPDAERRLHEVAARHAARPLGRGQGRRRAETAGQGHGPVPAPVHHGPDLDP
jgi:Insertion element 4 transposase N-terminal